MDHARHPMQMPTPPDVFRRPRSLQRCSRCAVVALAMATAMGPPVRSGDAGTAPREAPAMVAGAMRLHAAAYWAAHSPAGAVPASAQGTPAATFTVANFEFDDGTPGTVDTVHISVGESVLWQWVSGTHTVTSGTGSTDPNQGVLFNQPSDLTHTQFTFTFNSAGTFPFFCVFHELSNMRGVVEVSEPTAVEPVGRATVLGFIRDPAPNPTALGTTFRFALREQGHVRAEVFDAGGRRRATLVDAVLPAGAFSTAWDGRTDGGLAETGVYYVRLRLPGYDGSRRIIVRR